MDKAEMTAMIEKAAHLRGWISNSYAQVEYLLGDLVVRCREFSEFDDFTKTISHSAATRVSKIRSMMKVGGALSPYIDDLTVIVDAFAANQDIRNLLAHGFCEFHFTRSGDAGFYFRKFGRGEVSEGQAADVLVERTFRLIDLEYYKAQLVAQATHAVATFVKIRSELGWSDVDVKKLINVFQPENGGGQ